MTPEQAAALRAPFPPEVIGKKPTAGIMLDYVGHAATTDRLLQVDPDWTWEPATTDELQRLPGGEGMWIKLTVCGVTRFGWGDGKNIKEWISDAIRNAAMRFGVALDLWSKEDLSANHRDEWPREPDAMPISSAKVQNLKARCRALQAAGISIADHRNRHRLPVLDASDAQDLDQWDYMLTQIEQNLDALLKHAHAEPAPAEEAEVVNEPDIGGVETEDELRARIEAEVAALQPIEVRKELDEGKLELTGNPKMLRERLVAYRIWCALGQEELPPADPSPQEVLVAEEML